MVVVKLHILSIRVELEHSTVRYRCLISCTIATTAIHTNSTVQATGKNVDCAEISNLPHHTTLPTVATPLAVPVNIQEQ